jgi:hypothetical protein
VDVVYMPKVVAVRRALLPPPAAPVLGAGLTYFEFCNLL